MKQKLKKQDIGFTQIKNLVLNDKNLSWKAKGLFAYIYSKPNDWDFSTDRITEDSTDKKSSTRSGIQELEKNEYLTRKRLATGRVIYFIHHEKKPQCENPTVRKSHGGKIGNISNKDNKVIKNKEVIKNIVGKADGKNINLLIEKFKSINPSYERLFANRTQRAVLERLVGKYTFEKVGGMIDALPEIVTQKYAPQISTPVQLENKLGQLVIFVKQHKEEKGFIQV